MKKLMIIISIMIASISYGQTMTVVNNTSETFAIYGIFSIGNMCNSTFTNIFNDPSLNTTFPPGTTVVYDLNSNGQDFDLIDIQHVNSTATTIIGNSVAVEVLANSFSCTFVTSFSNSSSFTWGIPYYLPSGRLFSPILNWTYNGAINNVVITIN